MKAWSISDYGSPDKAFKLVNRTLRDRKPGEVKIQVEAFGLNYADVMARNGLYREAPKPPFVPGYEVVGEIIEADKAELLGKRVVAMTRFGGYAEQAITREEGIVEIGKDVHPGEAVALATQYTTAWHAAYDLVNLHEGDRVLIHAAAGGVGVALIQLAKLKGCTVYGTASSQEKLDFIKSLGCDYPVNYKDSDYEKEIMRLLGDKRIDVAFNPIGGSTFKKDSRLVGSGGRQVLYGGAERSGGKWGIFSTLAFVWRMGFVVPIFLMMKSKSILGVNMLKLGDNKPEAIQRAVKGVLKLHAEGKIKPHVGGDFNAADIAHAHELLESRKSKGKIVVRW